ncbi:ABC-2 type transport system permease protein [Clostridium acetobutylicum]|uniref:Related to ABC transporter permease component n=1 Tax=Clostridium acetobutylicum (strain ATCC 824 / DSM 792 / JCM 1419 / IAM 19013 / LMG 5710 / NBRC 13948 / NRRL B-527 / VKM B-1787 / 2291 / W) TaxID=272562 RepID=Q97MP6_CLOAB|nr:MULTISPECIES: ABC transporter permease [Clostridium]AAK78130.1 Related to ABC transporter permease component [Clostridium acetobutylicum ATCC 824]AEI31080.1 ABC transporter permease component [Clostridium acetobutylicum DSM 1731]AWV81808.1 ABC transporter permease [Clostridium acetobutylicum]MBC2395354.1 ABC transporter permease [Clostridium acetobutylicum]MBC2586427.1 ABC transporter permease [Clostridium acetobutylicum]
MMWNLIKNEFIKLRYKRKYIICTIVFALICIGFCAVYVKMQKASTPDAAIQYYKDAKSSLQSKEKNIKDATLKQQYDQQISQLDEQIKQYQQSKNQGNSNWKKQLKNTIDSLKDEKNQAADITENTAKESYNKQIVFYQYLLNHNIKPQDNNSLSTFQLLQSLLKLIGYILIPIIIAIFSADIVSGEYTPPTIKVLLSKPASRAKILASKFIASAISCIAIILLIELITYLITGIAYGFDNPSYPVLVGTKYMNSGIKLTQDSTGLIPILGSSYVIPLWQFLIEMFLFQILFIIGCCSFFLLLSVVLRSSVLSMTLSIMIVIALNIISQISALHVIMPFLFTNYGSPYDILTNSIPSTSGLTFTTAIFGVIYLIIFTILCYGIANYSFKKKDMTV